MGKAFKTKVKIIGINPYVDLPDLILQGIFKEAGRTKSPIPVMGTLNGHPWVQTLVRFQGAWRLYLNTPMRQAAQAEVGDTVRVEVHYDPRPRLVPLHPDLKKALSKNKKALATFKKLAPSRQKEINRYLGSVKTPETLQKNIIDVLRFLRGQQPVGLKAILRVSKK